MVEMEEEQTDAISELRCEIGAPLIMPVKVGARWSLESRGRTKIV